MYITLEQAKKHLNVDSIFKDDDLYILDLITVAEDSVSQHLDRPLCELEDANGILPASVVHAMLLMVGNLYANREPVSQSFHRIVEIPFTYSYLINLYKRYYVK